MDLLSVMYGMVNMENFVFLFYVFSTA